MKLSQGLKGLLVAFFCLLLLACSNNVKYQSGKDTVELYGDGTYQLLRGVNSEGEKRVILYNNDDRDVVAENVLQHAETRHYAYLLDEDGRLILLDIDHKELTIKEDVSGFTSHDQKIFSNLLMLEDKKNKK